MMNRIPFLLLCLLVPASNAPAGDKSPPAVAPKSLQGTWKSSLDLAPGSRDALLQYTLEIGKKDNPDWVRLGWSMYCGRTCIGGDYSYVGRLIGVEEKGKKRLLILAGEKGTRYEIEFQLAGDSLGLSGSLKGVEVTDSWRRLPAGKK